MIIDINGCKIRSKTTGLPVFNILDPCNCSSYYTIVYEPGYSQTRNFCLNNFFWNHVKNHCDLRNIVLKNKLCNLDAPWERCENLTDTGRTKIMRKCIHKGICIDAPGDDQTRSNAEMGYKLLTRETQLANVDLVFASMIAGCVITLMIVAMVTEFCNFPHFSKKIPNTLKRISTKTKSKPIAVSTVQANEQENVSVLYEDINEEEVGTLDTGIGLEYPRPSVENSHGSSLTAKHGNTQFSPVSQTQASQHHLQTPKGSAKPATVPVQTITHMVPKTKNTPQEKGGKVARPYRPPQPDDKDSSGYIHPL